MNSGLFLIFILSLIYIIDNHRNNLFIISSVVLIFINFFGLIGDFDSHINYFAEIFFPKFASSHSMRMLYIVIVSIINTVYLFYNIENRLIMKKCLSNGGIVKKLVKFFLYFVKYKWFFLSAFSVCAYPLFLIKQDLLIGLDVLNITQVPSNYFPTFNMTIRVFLIAFYIVFLLLSTSLLLFAFSMLSVFSDYVKNHLIFIIIPVVMNFIVFGGMYNFITKRLLNNVEIVHILIESSYNPIIKRCDDLQKKILNDLQKNISNDSEINLYTLFLNAYDVSLASRIKENNKVKYIFAIGNCQDNTYNFVYEYPNNEK